MDFLRSDTSTSRVPVAVRHCLVLITAVILLYKPTLNFDFVWDDKLYVVTNPAVQSWDYLRAAFTSPRSTWSSDSLHTLSAWRPLRNVSYLIDHSIYGLNPIGWHLTNITLHALTAVLVLLVIRRLLLLTSPDGTITVIQSTVALLATLIWTVHPVQTEIVAWVKSRDDLLATPLVLGALLAALPRYKNYEVRNEGLSGWGGLISASLLFGAALLSKENAIVFAGLYPVIAYLINPSRFRAFASRFWLPTTVFIVIGILFLAARDLTLGRTAQADWPGDTPLQTVLTMLHAFTRYVQVIVWPWPPTVLSADYDGYPIIKNWANPRALGGLTIVLLLLVSFAVSGLAAKRSQRAKLIIIGLAIFVLGMLPYANIIPMMQIMAERFLYLPTIGLAIALCGLSCFQFPYAASRFRTVTSKLCVVILTVLTMALAVQTWLRLPVWQNELTLFVANRKANPTSWRPANLYVKALLQANQTTAALSMAHRNLTQFPNDPDIVRTAAIAYLLNGHETTGTILTSIAVQLQPQDSRASNTLQMWKRMQ